MLGGLTAEPTSNPVLSYIFKKGTIWEKYPYALPALLVVIFSIISLFVTTFILKEKKKYEQLENIELKNFENERENVKIYF
jgi:Na+/H+ antiporter NhaC